MSPLGSAVLSGSRQQHPRQALIERAQRRAAQRLEAASQNLDSTAGSIAIERDGRDGHRGAHTVVIEAGAPSLPDSEHRASSTPDPPDALELAHQFFRCPLLSTVMHDPVVAADGITYERSAIEEWLKHHSVSPSTGQPLSSTAIFPNTVLCRLIQHILTPSGRMVGRARGARQPHERGCARSSETERQ